MVRSVAEVIRLAGLRRGRDAAWHLLLRWDVVFYKPFDLTALDPRRFVMAGVCAGARRGRFVALTAARPRRGRARGHRSSPPC